MDKERKDKKPLLGELFVDRKIISKEQLEAALEEQKMTGELLAQIIIKKNWADEEKVYRVLSEKINIPFQNLLGIEIDRAVISLVPKNMAIAHCLIPIKKDKDAVTVAMIEPQNTFTIDELRSSTGLTINPVLSSRSAILVAIEKYYGKEQIIEETIDMAEEGKEKEKEEVDFTSEDAENIKQIAEKAPVVKLVDAVITDALRNRASDIHIEPSQDGFNIRFRIDGVLHDVSSPPKNLYKPVVSRVKIMANMDIAEKRLPQDGSFRTKLEEKNVDIRVSTYPTIYGETTVMRLLVKERAFFDLTELGLEPDELIRFEDLCKKSCGIILVVGPTGCGKTTTLYSVLHKIFTRAKNIVTIEDPVEYNIEGISQSQINPKAGFTFANSLRSIMRQDPDIILIGEIRDLETAELAVRASLTGHLVFSTLHTNDAPGAVIRLIDMGIEPYLIASSLIGVLAQRLVRVNCSKCKEEIKPSPVILENFKEETSKVKRDNNKFYQGRGCDVCKNTGYQGREGVFEMLTIAGDQMREAIISGCKSSEFKRLAVQEGMRTLKENGLRKVFRGITTLEEVLSKAALA